MKHEQSAPAGYRPRFDGTTKLYLVRHKEYGELTVNGVNKYEAVHAAARARYTQMKKNASSVASALRLSRRTRRAKNEISEII